MKENDLHTWLYQCPFCGGDPEIIWHDDFTGYVVRCLKCSCICWQGGRSRETARKYWNTRAISDRAYT